MPRDDLLMHMGAREVIELDAQELEVLQAYERGELGSVGSREEIERMRAVALATALESQRTGLRREEAGDEPADSR
jgi:hypothetical protein